MARLLILALLVVFVIRTWSSMMARQRLRADAESGPAAPSPGSAMRGAQFVHPSPQTGPLVPPAAAPPVGPLPQLEAGGPLEADVRALMESGFEAGAVRLLCDELGMGIVEAQRTARAVAGRSAA